MGEDTKEGHIYYCPETKEWLFWGDSLVVKKKFKDVIIPALGYQYGNYKNLLEMSKEDEDDYYVDLYSKAVKFIGKLIGVTKSKL